MLPVGMVFRQGYLRIGRIGGAPVRLHWSVPLGVVAFSGFRLAPGAWLGVVLLILVHELGHAVAVWASGLRVVAVDVMAFGGLCRFEGYPTPRGRVLIAWAGVLAQAALLLCTLVAVRLVGAPSHPFEADMVGAFVGANLWLMLFNLLPIPPLDGVDAWGIIALFRAARARRRMDAERARLALEQARARAAAEDQIRSLDALDDHDLPPMPDEVRQVLDRVMAEGRKQHESEKKK
jgi:stage IV sporulation protein FB